MNDFSWLFLGHLAGDFLFQNTWMALNKGDSVKILVIHSLVYTLSILLFSLFFGGLSLPALALVFLSHVAVDSRRPTNWWTRYITNTDQFWLRVIVDQTFHLLFLAAALHI